MRNIQEELNRLREKLRHFEKSAAASPIAMRRVAEIAKVDLPPWESGESEGGFDASTGATKGKPSEDGKTDPLWEEPGGGLQRLAGIEQCVSGTVVETTKGKHFECETLYPFQMVHGNFAVAGLEGLPGELLNALCPEHGGAPSDRWAFLDTETIGLAGGAGSFAFLIGVGFLCGQGFKVRQYFLREPSEEPSVLARLADDLAKFRTLVTYNGRSFDAPLLETRYRLARQPVPFAEMPHLDLLFACRRLWKRRFDSCRLTALEHDVLGFERVGDVPGFLIPSLYANYLRSGDAASLAGVFTHNALDILSLACLTSMVAAVFENPEQTKPRHPMECLGLGRWLLRMGRREEALRFLWRAADAVIPEDVLATILWDIAVAERQLGRYEAMRKPLEQLLGFPNCLQPRALEALSILFERRLRNLPRALAYAHRLAQEQPGEQSAARVERLVKRLHSRPGQHLLEPAAEG